MKITKVTPKLSLFSIIIALVLTLLVTFVIAREASYASSGNVNPQSTQQVSLNTPAPLPTFLTGFQPENSNAAVSSALSYYFIAGNTFTPDGGPISYARQVIGCVNQMPLNIGFSAPVHLPQGSQVVSLTLFTYDTVQSATTSSAYIIVEDGMGNGGILGSASSLPNISGYQHNDSTTPISAIIDNQNNNYLVQWRKLGDTDSTYLSLCGVRIAYHAPAAGTFLPLIKK